MQAPTSMHYLIILVSMTTTVIVCNDHYFSFDALVSRIDKPQMVVCLVVSRTFKPRMVFYLLVCSYSFDAPVSTQPSEVNERSSPMVFIGYS